MAKPANLLNAMRSGARGQGSAPVAEAPAAPPAVPASADAARWDKESNPHYRPGRSKKTNITAFFDKPVKRQLRIMAAEQGRTIQDLIAEALNDLFAKHGKPEIAERTKREP